MARKRLPADDIVLETYKKLLNEFGYTSCHLVSIELAEKGFKGKRGGVITRQAVHDVLKKSEEGRALLAVTKERIGR